MRIDPVHSMGRDWKKDTLKKWVETYLFPDFSKRLTKYIVGSGIACIVTPDAIQFLVIDWLVRTVSLSQGEQITLADFQSNNAEYWVGWGLVAIALTHNLIYKWLETIDIKSRHLLTDEKRSSDIALFKELQVLLPSSGLAILQLRDHDFHNSFSLATFKPLEEYMYQWDTPEKSFHDTEINECRKSLINTAKKFDALLCSKSGPIGPDRQAVIPERCRDDWDLPSDIQNDVNEVNQAATDVYRAHQNLIETAKEKLGC